MPDETGFYIENLEEFQAALAQFPADVNRGLRTAMRSAGAKVRSGVAHYPRITGANRSPGLNGYSWYERGFGTRTVTGKAYPTSEVLGKSWAVKVTQSAQATKGVIGTAVSYAKFVQGRMQAAFHRARGWKTVSQVLDERRDAIWQVFGQVIEKALAKIAEKGK